MCENVKSIFIYTIQKHFGKPSGVQLLFRRFDGRWPALFQSQFQRGRVGKIRRSVVGRICFGLRVICACYLLASGMACQEPAGAGAENCTRYVGVKKLGVVGDKLNVETLFMIVCTLLQMGLH